MEYIGVFDMLKIGVGPSSSHTLGPWRAAQAFLNKINNQDISLIEKIRIDLYGSLSLTGKGHATDLAIILGLAGYDPVTIPTNQIDEIIGRIKNSKILEINGNHAIPFFSEDLIFHKDFLPEHPNGMRITAFYSNGLAVSGTYYSIGGGFILEEGVDASSAQTHISEVPYPIAFAEDILRHCDTLGINSKISDVVLANEASLQSLEEISQKLDAIWQVMEDSIFNGCHSEGFLPGGLMVRRRAFDMFSKLKSPVLNYSEKDDFLSAIRSTRMHYREIFSWVSTYAIAVNEVNAGLGRVVTAPTNGSAGVIPAVLFFYQSIENHKSTKEHIHRFLMTSAVVGSVFKRNATISAAMGGCQAEIGVSSAMAAAGLTELRGGSPKQCLNAAEIAMEHHLGMTCDPIAGLVQIPCIERNSMGAIKAINASELALAASDFTRVSLDDVVQTMWKTAQDMNSNYKETSEGGLAVSVKCTDC